MITLYHARWTRSVRTRWLLEELELPHELRTVDFAPPSGGTFSQSTPLGKLPVLEDGEVVICESGAIVEYVLEKHGGGRLAPAIGTPGRGRYLQWIHFAEGTAYPPLGVVIWHTRYRGSGDVDEVIASARERAAAALDFVEAELGPGPWLLGEAFSGADVMMGFTLAVARALTILGDRHPGLVAYLTRLETRPAYQRAIA